MRFSRHTISRALVLASAVAGFTSAHSIASAQVFGRGWGELCFDPDNTSPFSVPYEFLSTESPLFSVVAGRDGTATVGRASSDTLPEICFPSHGFDIAGGFAFGLPAGTIQANGADAQMALTGGWDVVPGKEYTFFRLTGKTNTPDGSVLFGDGGYNTYYTGASQRYFVLGQQVTVDSNDFQVELRVRVVGDAAQFRWRMNNVGTAAANLGVLFGCSPFQILQQTPAGFNRRTSHVTMGNLRNGESADSLTTQNYVGFTGTDTTRPIRLERKFPNNVTGFPKWVKFLWSQSNPYGMQIDTQPDRLVYKDADSSDLVIVANRQQILKDDSTMGFNLFGDLTGNALTNDVIIGAQGPASDLPWGTSFIERFPSKSVPAGAFADIVHYVHLAHTQGYYFDPYTLVVDMPEFVAWNSTSGTTNGYPDTVKVGAWLDNQYAEVEKEVTLQNVRMTITIPDNSGLQLAPGEPRVKNIGTVSPNAVNSASWNLAVDPSHPGLVDVQIQVEAFPGPVRTLTKTIRVAGSPTYQLTSGANLLTFPYLTSETSLDQVLVKNEIDPNTGEYVKLRNGIDYVAYTWDPSLRTYTPAQTLQRGVGTWIVPADGTSIDSVLLKQSALPTDAASGGLIVGLRPGWNLIGNPYNVPMKLSELVGVDEANPQNALSWDELVRTNAVTGSVVYFDGTQYQFVAGSDAVLEPNRGYWLFVTTSAQLRLVYPPLFQIGQPGITTRSTKNTFTNSDSQWRLQFAATSAHGSDNSAFVGVTRDSRSLNTLNVPKAPAAPNSSVEVSVVGTTKAGETRMAQAFSTTTQQSSWKLQVKSDKPGDVALTWPNLATLPRNVKVTLTDDATGETKDLRALSGYTVAFAQPGTRSFTVKAAGNGQSRPVITSAIVNRSSRDANAPIQVSYTLSDSALVTVRVLSASGQEVYTATRGRADNAGQNTVTWTLRDNANRAVAPGTYRVEIIAETTTGDRARRIVPVNVIR
jgi:hypothetical protein